MFAYCKNNPVINSDDSGHFPVAAVAAAVVVTTFVAVSGVLLADALNPEREKSISFSISKPRQTAEDKYSVYFLKKKGDISNDIVYVGRVKTSNFSSRMSYHNQRGRELVSSIDGLNYGECRFVEQAGMIWCHTISNDPINNLIRGIGPTNKKRFTYYANGYELAKNGSWLEDVFPISYFANQTENMLLNGTP